jgi:hypothetical protein
MAANEPLGATSLHKVTKGLSGFSDVASTTSPGTAGGACAPHPARPRTDGLRCACLFPSSGASERGLVAADRRVDWRLYPTSYNCLVIFRLRSYSPTTIRIKQSKL